MNSLPPLRLHLNENCYGCSPQAVEAIRGMAGEVARYPAAPVRLEQELAARLGVQPREIVVGGGSVRLIDGIIQALTGPADEVLLFERSFVAYRMLAEAHRRVIRVAPQREFVCDPAVLPAMVSPNTRLIFLANPNNPTGTIFTHAMLRASLEALPSEVIVVVDEAYREYVTDPDYPDTRDLRRRHRNLIVLRSFSKIHGLPGARVGFAIADEPMADLLRRTRIPFFLPFCAEDAALASLADQAFITTSARRNAEERERLFEGLRAAGLNAVRSQANFVFILFKDDAQKTVLFRRLLDANILVCDLSDHGQDRSLRITVGDAAMNERLLGALAM
jgi:histidinol-phosphate aminotransferase